MYKLTIFFRQKLEYIFNFYDANKLWSYAPSFHSFHAFPMTHNIFLEMNMRDQLKLVNFVFGFQYFEKNQVESCSIPSKEQKEAIKWFLKR